MKKILQKYSSRKIATQRAKSLNEVGKFYLDACKQIDENPFIRKKWSIFDRWYYKLLLGYVPKTPAEEMKDKLKQRMEEMVKEIEFNTHLMIKKIGEYGLASQKPI